MWLPGVAHEPPRSTNWLHINFPLYSPTTPFAGANPGYAMYGLDVHSHTSPKSCRMLGPRAGCGWKPPSSRKAPFADRDEADLAEPDLSELWTAAISHSSSRGSRALLQRAKASAS